MSEIIFKDQTDYEAGVPLPEDVALETFWSNPEAVRHLIYGTRTIKNAAPPHNHGESGGEFIYFTILSDTFGRYASNQVRTGIPLGPAATGSFAETTSAGITDKTGAKRLKCWASTIPGGVKELRVSLSEYHETAGTDTQVTVTFRSLSSINYKRGVAPEECSVDLAWTTAGAAAMVNHSAELDDLSSLGDPTLDREVEIALWLTSDLSASIEQNLLDIEVIALGLTSAARAKKRREALYPTLSVKEVRSGTGVIGKQFAAKTKEILNSLHRSLWGSTPGLLPNGLPDQRRTYQESITVAHTHEGRLCPTSTPGEILGKGSCLLDPQSFGFVTDLGESALVLATPPTMDAAPNRGAYLHKQVDDSADWVRYQFRRSIPAGCGGLVLRVGIHAGYELDAESYDKSLELFMSCSIESVALGPEIVTRLYCGEHQSPVDPRDPDAGFVELTPEDDAAHTPHEQLFRQGHKSWSNAAELTAGQLARRKMNSILYRVSKPIFVELTYPPARPSETYHPTTDYNVALRFKLRNSAGEFDVEAGCLWLKCETAPGY